MTYEPNVPHAMYHVSVFVIDCPRSVSCLESTTNPIYIDPYTVKPVCNDHLYNKIYYLWFFQQCVLMKTEGTNLLLLTISAFWRAPEGREVSQ